MEWSSWWLASWVGVVPKYHLMWFQLESSGHHFRPGESFPDHFAPPPMIRLIWYDLYIPGSSRYVKFLPFGWVFGWKGTNLTHLEDPGIYPPGNDLTYCIPPNENLWKKIDSKVPNGYGIRLFFRGICILYIYHVCIYMFILHVCICMAYIFLHISYI